MILKPIALSNVFFNCTNYLINWEDWTEQYSSSLEQFCESYKSIVFELNSIFNSIVWTILSTWSHIYIDWDLLTFKVADMILFFIKIIHGTFFRDKIGYPISVISFVWEKIGKLMVLDLIVCFVWEILVVLL